MIQRIVEFFRSVKAMWDGTTKKTRIILISTIAGILVVSLVTVIALNYKNYVLLYNGVSTQESATVLATLGEMGIEPRINNMGAIYVPDSEINRIRMQLAQNNFQGDVFNYDIYKEGGLTATQAEKNQWNINQLQNRLQDTILTFEEVEQAVVTISIPQPSIYALQDNTLPPTASVKITKKQGKQLTPEQVQGILNTVRNAISGLTDENISITDETGDMKLILESQQVSSVRKLDLTDEVNRSIQNKVLSILQPVYGPENVHVAANAVLDTDSQVTESTEYIPADPDNPQNNPLDSAEYNREKYGGGDGVAEGVVGANDNVDVPEYSARDLDIADADAYSAVDVLDYLVSSVRSQIVKEGLTITDLTTVAVIINTNTLPDEQKSKVIDLVSKASGIPEARISVQDIQFVDIPSYTAPGPQLSAQEIFIITGIALLAFAILLFIIITYLRNAKRKKEEQLAAELAAMEEYDETLALSDLMAQQEEFEPIVLPETPEQKLKVQIRDLAENDPEIVAQLIKTWLVQN